MIEITAQIDERLSGILQGLEFRLSASNARRVGLTQQLEITRPKNLELMSKYRPYAAAKREIENLQRKLEALNVRIEQEQVEALLSK